MNLSRVRKEKRGARLTTGLALGGGGAKGLAHIGVIKVLKNAGISIDFIAGTSMGALVGAWYAATEDIEFLEDLFLKIKPREIFPVTEMLRHKKGALFKGDSVSHLLKSSFHNLSFKDCKVPFVAVATDARNGDEVILKSGKLMDAVDASIALPLIFSPVEAGGKLLMDGGLVNPVPADIVREMGAEYVIAVDVSSRWADSPDEAIDTKSMYAAISSSLGIVEYQLAKNILKQADVVIKPQIFGFGTFSFGSAREIIGIGAEETRLHLREIRRATGYPELPKTFGEKFLDFLFHSEKED